MAHLILDVISLDYHETLMAASGAQAEAALRSAISENAGKFVLVVEGSIPTRDGGVYMEMNSRPAVDVAGLVQVLHRVGRLVEDMPEVAELECNPVIATADGVLVVDVRLRIDPEAARPALEDTRHLR